MWQKPNFVPVCNICKITPIANNIWFGYNFVLKRARICLLPECGTRQALPAVVWNGSQRGSIVYTVLSKPLNNVMTPEGISSKTTANSLGETGKLNFCKKS